MAHGKKISELRPTEAFTNHDIERTALSTEGESYKWFLKAQTFIKDLLGENSQYFKEFLSFDVKYNLKIRDPFLGAITEEYHYRFLKPNIEKQTAVLEAILENIQDQDGQVSKSLLEQKFDQIGFHPEVIRHSRGLFIESEDEQSKRTTAVKECVSAYEMYVKQISGIDDSGSALMGDSFSFKEITDKDQGVTYISSYPKLQISSLHTESGRNLQNGIKLISMGLMMAIRNISIHSASKDNLLSIEEALHIFSVVSLLWKTIDKGIIEALIQSQEFNASNSVIKPFKRARDYYRINGIEYPSVAYKNKLIEACVKNPNVISGYSCRPIITSFLKEEMVFLQSEECTLTEGQKKELKENYSL